MSVISKEIAKQIAEKLTSKSKEAAKLIEEEYKELVTSIYESKTPQAVKDTYSKHPEWFYLRSGIGFTGHGFSYEHVVGTRRVLANNGTDATLELDAKIADKIVKAKNKYEKAYKAYRDLKTETENALLALKTPKNIREHLPEAAQFLPPPISNALVVNFDSLKKRLEKQPTAGNIKVTL